MPEVKLKVGEIYLVRQGNHNNRLGILKRVEDGDLVLADVVNHMEFLVAPDCVMHYKDPKDNMEVVGNPYE